MAKSLFVLVAALCVIASATATPTFRNVEETDLQAMALAPELKFDWSDPAELLRMVQQILDAFQLKIKEASEEVQNAAQAIVDQIAKAAQDAADQWSESAQEWADKAAAAGVDIQDCLNNQASSLADVIAAMQTDSNKCASVQLADLMQSVEDAKPVGPVAEAVIAQAQQMVSQCQKKSNFIPTGLCLLAVVPTIEAKTANVVAQATILSAIVSHKAESVGRTVSLCSGLATAKHAAEGTTIINTTVECIKGKMNA